MRRLPTTSIYDRPLQVALACVALLGACKVTSDDIEYWKGTVKGPGKIVAVILTDKYPIELRTRAALALIEMEPRDDVNGIAELQSALGRLPEDEQRSIIEGMVPSIEAQMRSGEENDSDDPLLTGPPPQQVRAKDAAYLLISRSVGETKQRLTDAVVGWYAVDFNGRNLAGDFSAEQVILSLGSRAAAKLVDAIHAQMPSAAMVKIAELIGQLGDRETKKRAAARLVAVEGEMNGEAYLEWLKNEIRSSLREANREINESSVTRIATLNRGNFIKLGTLAAMKYLGNEEAVASRLIALSGHKELPEDHRRAAIQAMEGNATAAHLNAYLNVALDAENPIGVRDDAFDRISDIRSTEAIPRLWPLAESTKNDLLEKRLRWRAAELILSVGGIGIIRELFRRLPSSKDVQYEPEELEGYATRMSQMTPPPTPRVIAMLNSRLWWQRIIAIRYLERKGTAQDVAKLQRLTRQGEPTVGEGWNDIKTVGKAAEASLESLRERLAQPEPRSSEAGRASQ
ncbi:MAG: hypothetical protein AAF355_03375 [Myxococcota bacterium]